MAGVVDLIDRAAALPPGPELSAALAALSWEKIPNARLVEVLQARSRQLSHEQAECYAGMVEISHAVAVEKLPEELAGKRAEAVARAREQFEWAAHEIAAGLTLTPGKADRELGFGLALCERLPLVFTALQQGHIDLGKARVFVDYLDPANGEITDEQARRLCQQFVPIAPGLTTKQLADRLYRALLAIDPQLRRRRYERAVQARGVAVYLNPRTGTATMVGDGLPADEAAAAAERNDRLVDAARRAGHPGTRGQISADLYLGMLNGAFHGLTEHEIIGRVLATRRPEDHPHPGTDNAGSGDDDPGDDDTVGSGDTVTAETASETETETETASETGTETTADSRADTEITATGSADETGTAPDSGTGTGTGAGVAVEPERPAASATSATSADAAGAAGAARPAGERWAGERVATREGIEIRAGLGTLAGCDERPGEIPGLGPVGAHIARTIATAQRRGARWLFAIVDPRGHLLLAGPLRRRPHTTGGGGQSPPVRGGVVEVHLTPDELARYTADPALPDWHPLLDEITRAWDQRDELRKRLAANPAARFARGALADHVCVRDRHCVGPGCTCPARRSDLDHTREHGRGGHTTDDNIGPACRSHHLDKDRGWTLTQPEPGLFRWVSPLGRVYWTRGEPIRPDLPDPDPAPNPHEESSAEVDQRLRRYEPRMLQRPATNPPRPPPPEPEPALDDDPPPF